MDETKKVLRSLLVSSSTVLTVLKLNDDYKEVMGYDIPYKDLGYEKLLDFLNAIPDVLTVKGCSLNSQVELIVTEKIAHINDMILKQKIGKNHYKSNPNQRKKFVQQVELVTSPTSTKYGEKDVQTETNNNAPNLKATQSQKDNFKKNRAKPTNQNEPCNQRSSKTNIVENFKTNIKNQPEKQPRAFEKNYEARIFTPIRSLKGHHENKAESTNRNEIFHPKSSRSDSEEILNVDVSLRPEKKIPEEQPQTCKKLEQEDRILRRQNFNDESHRTVVSSENNTKCRKSKIKRTESGKYYCGSRIPMQVQDDLKKLIKGIPEGIWCSELPDEYKKIFGKELCFRKFGYRCLIHMCIDLKNIFYCNKESTCDFKLYDITRPIPDVKIVEDDEEYSRNVSSFEEDEPPSLPTLDWKTYAQLYPKDVVGRGFVIPRDFVNQSEIESDIFRVVVAQVHDPSKFWLFRDDKQLDALMDEMQPFYKTNKERYRIPEQFLETGLYCAAMWQKEFHRCVIVKMQTNETFVHLFYIDYGSLATVPKNELCFLTKDFVRLPAQAIRARLADIYPPVEFATWTYEASGRFHQLADMKHLEARIVRVSMRKKVIEVRVKDPISALGRDINSILVDEGHALYWNQYRTMNICAYNCTPRGNFIHLFPDFEEIEYCSQYSKIINKSFENLDEENEWKSSTDWGYSRNISRIDKLKCQLDTWIDSSELENYQSHQSPSTSSANNGKLLDVDEFNRNIMPQKKNESSNINNYWSLLTWKACSTGDEEEPSCRGRSDTDCSDLIQLDVPLEYPILSPEIVRISDSMSQNTVSAIYYEEDENSDVKSNTSVVSEVTVLPTRVNNTSTPIPTVPHCSSINLGLTSLCSPKPACHYKYWHSQYSQRRSLGNCLGNNQMHFPSMRSRQDVREINTCTSNPNEQKFTSLSMPNVHCSSRNYGIRPLYVPRLACHCQSGYAVYQRWSLKDFSENNQIYYPSMNTPINVHQTNWNWNS